MDRAQLVEATRDAWREVLRVDVTEESDFYESGGDSLNAADIANRVVERHPDVGDLDIAVLTALLEEAQFDSVIEAICAELDIRDAHV